MTPRSALLIFVLGGFSLTMCDRVHIAYGVLEQEDQSIAGQAFWVFPMFGALSLVAVWGYGWLRRFMGEEPRAPGVAATAMAAVFALGAYACTGPLDTLGPILMIVLALVWIMRVALGFGRASVLFCLLLAVAGPLGEAALSALGRFHYLHPDMGSVPVWLPGIYLHGGLLVAEVDAWLSAREKPAAEGDA